MIAPKYVGTLQSRMAEKVAFYIPSRTAGGKDEHLGIVHDDLVRVTTNFLTFEFGGATVVPATGFYVHERELRVQDEKVIIAYAFATPELVSRHIETIEALANDLCCRFDQTAVAFELSGALYFASPTQKFRKLNRYLHEKFEKGREVWKSRPWAKYVDIEKLIESRRAGQSKA